MVPDSDLEGRSSLRILVVDDDPGVAESLVEYLSDFGFDATAEGNARQALERFKTGQYDVAVVDMRLPEMRGDELILRAYEVSPRTGFLIATGSINFELSVELRQIGLIPEHVFQKPVADMTCIIRAIEELAGKKTPPAGSS
jgi:CheY-like chemotaxis protein